MRATTPSRHVKESTSGTSIRTKGAVATVVGVVTALVVAGVTSDVVANAGSFVNVLPRG